MSDKVDEALAQMDRDLNLTDPEEETPPAEAVVEAPEEPEAPVEETPEEAPEESEEEEVLLAGKYKTPEELESAYKELQSRMGSQGEELGQLRKLLEERLPEQEEEALDINQGTIDWFDEQIDTNPHGAALWALQNDSSGALYDRAMDAWYDMPGQARRASAFERALEQEQLKAQLAEQTKPLEKQAKQQAIAAAWNHLANEIPDLNEYADAIVAEAKDAPELLRNANTPEEMQNAYRKLYRMARGAQATTVASATAENAKEQRDAARAAKLSGASATQTKAVTPEKVSDDEKWLRDALDPYLERYMAPEDA